MSLKAQDVYAILNSRIEEGSGGQGTTNYNDLQNKPKINGVELSGEKTLEDLGVQPSGDYLTEETDPTVPSWAKQANKPTYTAEEVGALPDDTEIPEIDSTLSVSGKAADAKAAGDKFAEIEDDITDIKYDFLDTSNAIYGEASGKNILIDDAAEKGFNEFKIYGKSEQDKTTGAQLFDIQKATTHVGAYGLTTSIDGENIKISGVASDIPGNNSVAFRILNYPENLYGNTFSMDIVDSTGAQGSYVYVSQSENAIAISFNTSLGAEVNLVFRLMVNSGSEALPWEPYTGGKASPNPNYPQEIVSAGNVMTAGAQLLNINSGEISESNIENITNTLTSGETYTYTNIDSPVPTIIGGRNASGDYIPFDNGVYASAGNGFTFVMPDNVAYLILGGSGGTIDKSMRFMLNSGSTALPWEPYTGGVPGVNPYEGEINVTVGGKNLVPFPYLSPLGGAGTVYEADGVTYTVQADGGIKCVGTPTNIFGPTLCRIRFSETQMNTTTNDSGSATEGEVTLSGGPLYFDKSNNATFIYWASRVDTPVDMTIYPQVEYGTVATAYEPYKTPQTLTLSTPGGLPGIPVSSGGNYTDENGQKWVCDEIDLKRGKYVKRVKSVTFDGSENWEISSSDERNQYFKCDSTKPDYTEDDPNMAGLSSMVKVVRYNRIDIYGDNDVIAWIFYWRLRLSNLDISAGATVDDLKQFLASNPITVYYTSLTPIETDLPAEEIAAYKALHTYTPSTVISNDAEAYVELNYIKDIEQFIDDTVNEAIDSSINDYDTEIKSFVNTNYVKKTDLESDQDKLEKYIESYYAMRRNGKVYQTKLYKFATNPTSTGEKLLSNTGLVFEPSTDTTEGQDDYLNGTHPMFEWVNVNYVRDNDGAARPTAIEGMDNYATSGSVDVGVMQMSFYWKWDSSNAEYDLVTVSDSPHPELGLEPWPECVKQDGTILPWCIGSKYVSGIANDGLLRSQPNLRPENYQSHNNMITNYQLKGEGYWGAGAVRNLFQIVFNAIKGATKNSQNLYQGVTNWNFQYDASVERSTNETYFPVTNAQAENLIVGHCVEVGYGSNNNGTLNKDRGVTTMRQYAHNVKILSIETLDDNNKAVYLDIEDGFNTTPVQLTDELSSPIIMSSMHCYSGMTDSVLGKHDGSPVSNTNAKYPYRVQGREYAVGGYVVASDVVMDFQSDYSKNVYVAEKGTAHSSSDNTIRSTYKMIGNIPASSDGTGADWWVGDISVDMDTGTWFPSAIGSSNTQGYGDRCYTGGTSTSGTREYLQGGRLWSGSAAGSACLYCRFWLGGSNWDSLGCD